MTKEKSPEVKTTKVGRTPLGHGVGRRKSSVARAWLKRGSGKVLVNGESVDTYFQTIVERQAALLPFAVCPMSMGFDVSVNVFGGGKTSQSGAVKLGIARALLEHDETMRPVLRKYGLLTVDARVKERKKYGQRGARRKFQFVKR